MTQKQQLLFEDVGKALLCSQLAERMLARCLIWVFPDEPQMTLDNLARLEAAVRGRTLGRLINRLRGHTQLPLEFDVVLDTFLQSRNTLVHSFFDIRGFSYFSDDGLKIGVDFANKVQREGLIVFHALTPLYNEFAKGLDDGKLFSLWSDVIGGSEQNVS